MRSFNAKNLGSVGQRAAKLPAKSRLAQVGPGPAGRLFLRPPNLTASNFEALESTDLNFSALKDLNLL